MLGKLKVLPRLVILTCLFAALSASESAGQNGVERLLYYGMGGPGSDARVGKPFLVNYQIRADSRVTGLVVSMTIPRQARLLKATIDGKPAPWRQLNGKVTWTLIPSRATKPYRKRDFWLTFRLSRRCSPNGVCWITAENKARAPDIDGWYVDRLRHRFVVR